MTQETLTLIEQKRTPMWKTAALLLAYTLLFLTLSLTSVRQKSATVDEVTHIPAGYTHLALGDFRLNLEHPPFIKLLTAAPLLWFKPRVETNDPAWINSQSHLYAVAFGARFLYEWNDAERMIFWSRVPVILLALLLGFGVFFCARDFYGWRAGVAALTLYLFCPDILAHGQLVTTDLGVTCFLFFSVYAFYCTLRRLRVRNVLLTCLCVGLALATKFSGVLVFPMLALVGAAFAFSPTPVLLLVKQATEGRVIESRQGKLAAAGVVMAVAALSGLVVIWAAYGFRYQISADPVVSRALNWAPLEQNAGLLKSLLLTATSWKLVPEGYGYGFALMLSSIADRGAFLMGEVSNTGWWYYFLITFLVKTPLPLIVLIVSGFFLLRRYGAGLAAEAMLLLPAGFYWVVALGSNLNIGHRHLLPIYPFLIVFAAKVARVFEPPRVWRLAVPCALLLAWYSAGTLWLYPHFLAYFNEIAGGPAGGYRWLVDSNLDWGQDLKGLARFRRAHPNEPFYVCYFGMTDPAYYGIEAQQLPGFNLQTMKQKDLARFDQVPSGALVAISATNLQFIRMWGKQFPGSAQFEQRLRSSQPIAHIGYSILIYRMR